MLLLRLPRRARRRLLLPPGWLALGFLLLVGCLALRAHWRQLQLTNVVQLTVPGWQPGYNGHRPAARLFSLPRVRRQLGSIHYWRSLDFVGRPVDSLTARRLRPMLTDLRTSLQRDNGLLIRFAPATRYRYLVQVLEALQQGDVKKYALDIHRRPYVLYVPGPHFKPAYSGRRPAQPD